MGMKEDIVLNLKGYDIEYQGKKLYVLDQIEYEGNTYICVIHLDELPNAVYNFLKKESSTEYRNIEDEELLNILSNKVGENILADEVEKILNERK